MTDRFPASVYEAFAARAGVSVTQARNIMRRLPSEGREGADAIDALLKAHNATAQVEALSELDEGDIEDSAAAENPVKDLKEIVDRRAQNILRARVAAHARWAKEDGAEAGRKMRAGLEAKFLREVDPDGVLSEDERRRRAEHAKKAYYLRLALKSSQARRARKEQRQGK